MDGSASPCASRLRAVPLRAALITLLLVTAGPVQPAFPHGATAALPRFEAEPAVGGPGSTIGVRIPVPLTRNYTVSLSGPCTSRSSASYPWTQTLQLPGRDYSTGVAVLQFARPLGGWCNGHFHGAVSLNAFTQLTKVGDFAFTIRPHVRARLPERPCRPRGSKTVANSPQARVFTIRSGKLTYTDGCLFRSRTHVQLAAGSGWYTEPETVGTVRLAGPFASYTLYRPAAAEGETSMVVTDLRTAARGSYIGLVEVLGEVLTPTGTVAWLGHNGDDPDPALSVRTLNAAGSTLLDRSPDIHPGSLRLSGSTLTWLDGGVEERATL